MSDLDRFKSAQARPHDGFETAVNELTAGRKRSHWIWYIFPQLEGLGRSPMAVQFGVRGEGEAAAYLRDPELRSRLLQVTGIVASHLERTPVRALDELMGSEIDAQKLVSSLTLFREVARRLNDVAPIAEFADLRAKADAILRVAAAQGYPECPYTLKQLADKQR